MGTGKPLDDEVLRQMASLVAYEYDMMGQAADIVTESSARGSVEHVLALEAFLLHYRNLLDFFAPRNKRPTDIVWSDFMTQRVNAPEEHRTDLDKWLAHLTTNRLEVFKGNRKGWPVLTMKIDLEEAWDAFLREVDAEHAGRGEWFADPIQAEGLGPGADEDDLYSS